MSEENEIKIGDKIQVILNGRTQKLEIINLSKGDPDKGTISYLSPLAQAILGRECPGQLTIKLENGRVLQCQLLAICHRKLDF